MVDWVKWLIRLDCCFVALLAVSGPQAGGCAAVKASSDDPGVGVLCSGCSISAREHYERC